MIVARRCRHCGTSRNWHTEEISGVTFPVAVRQLDGTEIPAVYHCGCSPSGYCEPRDPEKPGDRMVRELAEGSARRLRFGGGKRRRAM